MSSVVGLEMPNAWRTGQTDDPSFDISANELNLTTNREMWIPTGTIDWSTALHTNALDPVSAQDLATKNYVDINGGALWSTFPATQSVDMDTNLIINLVDPTNPQEAATKAYVDANAGATDLDGLTDVTITAAALNDILQFNGLGQWVNQPLSVPAGSVISQGDSSVAVIDAGSGRVDTTIDNTIRATIDASLYDIKIPITMNSQKILSLGTPTLATDATTKDYVDTEIANAGIKSDLNSLTDVTIATPLINQILVNDGAGQWVNQIITKTQLSTLPIAYTDETNTFSLVQQFQGGSQYGIDIQLDLQGGFISDVRDATFALQATDPSIPPNLQLSTIFYGGGADFGSPDPLWQVFVDRGGTLIKKPIVTSESVFSLRNFSNGMFEQETGVKLITDGGIGIKVQLFNENQLGQPYEVVLNGQIHLIGDPDSNPSVGNNIDLTVGTDIAPTKHWVWIEIIATVPTMQSSTVEFPTTGDFAVVGTFLLQSQASVLADGAYAVNSPDYEIFDESSRGHLAHINDRLVVSDALWFEGVDFTVVPAVGGGTLGNVTFTSAVGESYELHREDIEAFDITTGIALIENEGTQPATSVTRVNDLGLDLVGLTCADGTTVIANNDRINVVVYTIHQDAEPNSTNYGINLPFTPYTNDADAINDVNNFAITSIPTSLRGTAFLVAEFVIKITNVAASFEILAERDLRGQIAGAAAGSGGGGGGGASSLNDLSDVTINSAALDQILQNDGAGQWVNVNNPAALLAGNNVMLGYQDYTAIADPTTGANDVVRFFTEVIDANNTALYCYLRQNGIQEKVRVA